MKTNKVSPEALQERLEISKLELKKAKEDLILAKKITAEAEYNFKYGKTLLYKGEYISINEMFFKIFGVYIDEAENNLIDEAYRIINNVNGHTE